MTSDHGTSLRIGTVTLTVHDLDRVGRFYREAVGLHDLGSDAEAARLGVGDAVLLELRRDARAPARSPREAGLFHTAFLLPGRADLGRWMRHAAQRQLPVEGLADHGVSEAVYLSDPENNGVEIYSDRPRDTWVWSGGAVALRTDPLDVDSVTRAAGPLPWTGVPEGTVVGHVHLKVGAIPPAEAFYAGVLGVPVTARCAGGIFFGAGRYHHHLAANVWVSRNAVRRTEPAAGLAEVRLLVTGAEALDAVAHRAVAAGVPVERHGAALVLRDPWGTPFTLTAPGT